MIIKYLWFPAYCPDLVMVNFSSLCVCLFMFTCLLSHYPFASSLTVFKLVCLYQLYSVGICHCVFPFHFYYIRMFCLCCWAKWSFIKFIISLWSVGFWHLISEIVFCWYRGGLHVSLCQCYCVLNLGKSYLVTYFTLVFCSKTNYGSMCSQSAIFLYTATVIL